MAELQKNHRKIVEEGLRAIISDAAAALVMTDPAEVVRALQDISSDARSLAHTAEWLVPDDVEAA